MSRITMERNGPMQNGSSRIPRFDYGNRNMASTSTFNNLQPLPGVGASQKPSRLEQMQMEYQKNMHKEKEDKLIATFEGDQKRALNRVNQNKGGNVREFFNERRAGSGGSKNSTTPTIEQLYQQKRLENQFGQQNGYTGNGGKSISKLSSLNRGNVRDKRPSAGRDRANPLAPIHQNNAETDNPFNKRKPQIVRPRTYKGVQSNKEYAPNMAAPRSAPNGYHNDAINDYTSDDSPLPSSKQLQHLQQKRKMLQDQRQSNKMHTTNQNGHINNRKTPQSKRTSDYEYESSDEDEGYDEENNNSKNNGDDEMKRKQQQLLAQIEAQQRELDRLRNERMTAEQEEKKEVERRKKLEEERRKRKIEEEKRRQKEEEEERIKQQWEEEKQQKMEIEKRRMRNMSQSSNDNNNGYHSNSHYNRHPSPSPPPQHYAEETHSPTPPPKPRPANTRKVMPKKQPQKPPSPGPLPQGDHVALYEQADQIEGAYENVGRLKACFNCGRKFAEDRLEKHEQSCKNITKKRKVMDPSKLRTKGTDMEQYRGHRQPTPPKAKKNNWRSKHENFMQAIKYAKKVSQIEKEGGNIADLPPPPASENPDYVQCPYCSRKFNEMAAERHIPHCKNTKARAKPPPQRRR